MTSATSSDRQFSTARTVELSRRGAIPDTSSPSLSSALRLHHGHVTERYHDPPALWQPSRLTSPYRVLSAAGVQNDYYTSCLSWGKERIALTLRHDLHLFHPSHARQQSAVAHLSDPATPGSFSQSTRPTAVAVSRSDDAQCFVGLADGSLHLYNCTPSGCLRSSHQVSMPASPLHELTTWLQRPVSRDTYHSPVPGNAAETSAGTSEAVTKAAKALSTSAATLSSVTCLSTTSAHPWLAAACTSGGGLCIVDARQEQPCTFFGQREGLPSAEGSPSQRLQAAAQYLQQQDRLCSTAWNSNGSLIATGGGDGVVQVWSANQPHLPVHTLKVQPGATLKALAFHPTEPYEVLVGGEGGNGGLRVYDVATAHPILRWVAHTSAQTTQALYAPDGRHILTAQGARVEAAAVSQPEHINASPLVRGRSGTGASNEGRSVQSHALVVWQRGTPHRHVDALRSLLLRENQTQRSAPDHFSSDVDVGLDEVQSLSVQYTLTGHRSRPLCVAAPFPHSTDSGCVASVASGEDDTMRFWRVFKASSATGLWEQRSSAAYKTVTSQDELESYLSRPMR